MENYKDLIPWGIGILTTLIALKRNWIGSLFTKQKYELEVADIQEDLESKSLDNVEKSMKIYRGMVDDLRENIDELKVEIKDLKVYIKDQQDFINEQRELLDAYKAKFGEVA